MQFKHPEILYLLFLLVIPVLVHLFQFRKFQTELFTNVKFLKKAVLQTRKSSKIKKWLLLFTRLLLLAAVIFAFAQPYIPSDNQEFSSEKTIIYLDNSYSMQAKGKSGILLKRAVQDLLESLPEEGNVSLFTNDSEYKDIAIASLREKLLEIDYSHSQLDVKTLFLKANTWSSKDPGSRNNFIAISDFKLPGSWEIPKNSNLFNYLVRLEPENIDNVSVDSAYIASKNVDQTEITVSLNNYGTQKKEIPVALYNGDNLLAKKSVEIESGKALIHFSLPSAPILKGKVHIEDSGLLFDNELYFSINPEDPVKVVVINNSDASFLKKIYTQPEFELHIFPINKVNFNELSSASLVILNEPQQLSGPLMSEIKRLKEENTVLVIIPFEEADLSSYNSLFKMLNLPHFREKMNREQLISEIIYQHPLYESVFEKKVTNFQYPKVNTYYRVKGYASPVLKYENNDDFLLEKQNTFVFTSPLNLENSNFQKAPLIVPIFYNIGHLALSSPTLYSVLGQSENISIQTNLRQDEILKLKSSEAVFIPRQHSYSNKVALFFEDTPHKKGHYEVVRDTFRLKTLSFNLDRAENDLHYLDLEPSKDITIHSNVPAVFNEIQTAGKVDVLWKWFVIFALIFLLTETLILKYFK